jgi:imidazolonepropionase-like amidohydrolase
MGRAVGGCHYVRLSEWQSAGRDRGAPAAVGWRGAWCRRRKGMAPARSWEDGVRSLISCVAALLAGACAFQASTQPDEAAVGLVISDVTVVSGERAAPLEHAYVRIRDGRIAEVSSRPIKGVEEIDGKGRFLIPGLIDTHVHLAIAPGFPASMTAADAAANPEIVAEALAQDPRSYLYFGFTTLLDLVGSGERIARWNALEVRPDAYFCGAAVILNGKMSYVRHPGFSYAESTAEFAKVMTGAAQEAPEAVIGRIAGDGAICVKTMYDSFIGMTPSVEELKALIAAAHARGLSVFIHANRREAQARALAAGIDIIAHGMWRNPGEAPELDAEAGGILQGVVDKQIGYQPTTQVIVGELDMLRADYLKRGELADVYPARLIEWYARALDKNPVRTRNAGAESRIQGTIRRGAEVTRYLAERDARLLFASDTPSAQLHTNPPGLNARLEMDNWIAGGVLEAKLFRAMTIDNARMMKVEKEIGTVEAGKKANLVLLGADPLKGVRAYDVIETVFLHGKPIARGTLSARRGK